MKEYTFNSEEKKGSLSYDISEFGELDSSKYTLLDLYKEESEFLKFNQRFDIVNSWLEDHTKRNTSLDRPIVEKGCKTTVSIIDNKNSYEFLNFTANDYLNLSQHPRVVKASIEALEKYGAGAGASPAILGTTDLTIELEELIAKHKGCEKALIQPSGFVTNIGVIKTLLKQTDVAIYDMYSHASLIEGTAGAGIFKVFFKHNDLNHLEYMLKRTQNKYVNSLVIVEGVYSMDGDISPLDKIVELSKRYGAFVLVDDAHGTGVIGKTGKGIIEHFGLEGQVDIVTGTFSKALGSVGGFVTGKKDLIEYIRMSNKAYFCSTAPFIASVAASLESIKIVDEEPELRVKLWKNINYLKEKLADLGIMSENIESPIIPLLVKSDVGALELSQILRSKGIITLPVFYPVVPKNKPRVRLSLTADHSIDQIDYLISVIKENISFLSI